MKWVLLGAVLLVLFVILEGKRQEKKYGRSRGGSLMRAGLLDFQRHLEPERKVEILLERRERTMELESGDEPTKDGTPRSGTRKRAGPQGIPEETANRLGSDERR